MLSFLTSYQCTLIKGYLVDIDNRFNKVFSSFVSLHSKFSPGNRVINNFSDQFPFNLFNKQKDDNLKVHIQLLDNMVIKLSSIPSNVLIIMDTSVKYNIVMSISHMHIHNNPITKTLHYVVYVASTEAKLFAIKYGINQAMNCNDISSKIIVITDSIHVARKIFDLLFHSYRVHIVAILSELCNYLSSKQFYWISGMP